MTSDRILRTNQIGGNDPKIYPIAPTQLFGTWLLPGTDLPIVTILFTRIMGAIALPDAGDWAIGLMVLLAYGAIAIPLGFSQKFLHYQPWKTFWRHKALLILKLFFMPALVEELFVRVLLLPYPRAGVTPQMWLSWAAVSLFIFILYHPLNAITLYKIGYPTFFNSVFLNLTGLLGIVCTIAYWFTGSLLIITCIHWIVVCVWLILLGGMKRLHPQAV